MSKNLELSIFEVVGSPLCVASSDGQKVCDRLKVALKEGRNVMLSFHNITTLTSAFLNAAIGQLYGTFSEEEIRSLLNVRDMQQDLHRSQELTRICSRELTHQNYAQVLTHL